MLANRAVRTLFLKTGIVSVFVALIVALRVDFAWGAAFATGSVFGLANWAMLAVILIALTERKAVPALLSVQGKVVLLGVMMFAVLPAFAANIGAFLLGFMMFLITAVLEAAGMLLSARLRNSQPDGRPLPKDWRSLFLGSSPDV